MATYIYTPFLPKKIPSKTVSFEVGFSRIRVVKPDFGRAGMDVQFTHEYDIPTEILHEGVPQKEVIFAQEFSKIQKVVQYKNAILVLPTHLFTSLLKKGVCKKEKDLGKILAETLQKEHTDQIGTYVFDYKIHTHDTKTGVYSATIFLLEGDTYARYTRSMTLVKIALVGILPVAESVLRILNLKKDYTESQVLYLGEEYTELVVGNPEGGYTATTYSVGGLFVHHLLQKNMPEKNRIQIREHAQASGTGVRSGEKSLLDMYARMYAPVLEDIRKTKDKNAPLFLCGSEAVILGVREIFLRELGCEVCIQNPLEDLFIFEKAIPTIHHNVAVAYAAGIGAFVGK